MNTHDPPPIESVTGVVLAGGKSRRMGADKAFVRLRQETLTERCLAVLRSCFARTLIVARHPAAFAQYQVPVAADDVPGLGPLGGILTALRHAETPAVFVVACDMPFLDAGLIREMASALGAFDAVAAKIDDRFEPLHAVYHRRILPAIEARISDGKLSVYGMLETLRTRVVSPAELAAHGGWRDAFINVNTPAELERARNRVNDRDRDSR